MDENLGPPDYPAMPRPDLVASTAFTSQANRAYEIAGYFRHLSVPVVMGGIHAAMCLDEVMERVDSVVTGEAESVWLQVLEDTRRGGLQCLRESSPIHNPATAALPRARAPRPLSYCSLNYGFPFKRTKADPAATRHSPSNLS